MSRINDLLATEYIGRHCTNAECRKCKAQAHWYRRKAWRSSKRPVRNKNGRK